MKFRTQAILTSVAIAAMFTAAGIGCNQSTAENNSTPTVTPVSNVDTSKYILADEPDGAVGVISARADAKDGDEIVLMGRIGGAKTPFIKGRSAFLLIDAAKQVVAGGTESGEAELCLEDCCASLRADCTTIVKLVDDQGEVLKVDARQVMNADVDDLVVVHGRIQRDEEQGTFIVIADGVHVRR